MKKLLCLTLALIVVLSIASCKNPKETIEPDKIIEPIDPIVVAGRMRTFLIKPDRSLWAWGDNPTCVQLRKKTCQNIITLTFSNSNRVQDMEFVFEFGNAQIVPNNAANPF